ncbi:MAG: ureidoglycolate lyase [Rhodobacteraceae bacterium]|nr:ureidoglycolate lyase [Paracoccaceae bacterium]
MTMVPAQPLDAEGFAPFGDIIDARGPTPQSINAGHAQRYHDLARLDHDPSGHLAISVFVAEAMDFPVAVTMLERHPRGPQCFVPICGTPTLIVVAGDRSGVPGSPRVFLAPAGTGVSYRRGTWHGVLTPIGAPGHAVRYAVIDWTGPDMNLETYPLPDRLVVQAPQSSH